ncbi:hypothetical protein J4439_03530 [Candidatus Woesearchaeota archaeon]|nr:hypothetical protein [Candidatus Woesearchaeota archaeon]
MRRGSWASTTVLGSFVLALLVLTVLGFVVTNILSGGGEGVDKQACSQSVRMSSQLKIGVGTDLQKWLVNRYGSTARLECATEYLSVKETEPEALQATIADSMVDCWQMFGEGNLELFDTKDASFCAVCSRLEFEQPTALPGFTRYLMAHNPPGKDVSYFEYFKGVGRRCGGRMLSDEDSQSLYEQSGLDQLDTINTANPLAVIYYTRKNAYPDGFLGLNSGEVETSFYGTAAGVTLAFAGLALCATVAGCSVGGPMIGIALVGAGITGGALGYGMGAACTSDYDAYIVLWDYSKLADLDCTYLESESTPLVIKEV